MRGMRYGEIARAVGPVMGGVGWLLSRVSDLKGTDLMPLEVTLVEPIAGHPQTGRELERAGFDKLMAFTLPEFTFDNASHVYVDGDGTTIAEAIWVKGTAGAERSTVAFSSLIEEGPVRRLRTVEAPRDAPLDPPPGWVTRFHGGSLAERAAHHRAALAALGHRPARVNADTVLDQMHIGHLENARHLLSRGVYLVAAPELVQALFEAKGLSRAPPDVAAPTDPPPR